MDATWGDDVLRRARERKLKAASEPREVASETETETMLLLQVTRKIRFAAAASIQAIARGALARESAKLSAALRKCDEFAVRRRDQAFYALLEHHADRTERRCTRQPFYRWKLLTKLRSRKRLVFTRCYWPFYVWRRETQTDALCRKKARFLIKVFRSYQLIRHMRAWMAWRDRRLAKKVRLNTLRKQLQMLFLQRAAKGGGSGKSKCILIKTNWAARGANLRRYHFRSMAHVKFQAWRYYAMGRVLCRKRAAKYWRAIKDDTREALIPPFPGPVALLPYFHSSTVPGARRSSLSHGEAVEIDRICAPIHDAFKEKDKRMQRGKYLEFVVFAPRYFKAWKECVEYRRKKVYAWIVYAKRTERRALKAWRRLACDAKEDRQREEQAKGAAEAARRRISEAKARKTKMVSNTECAHLDKEKEAGTGEDLGVGDILTEPFESPEDDITPMLSISVASAGVADQATNEIEIEGKKEKGKGNEPAHIDVAFPQMRPAHVIDASAALEEDAIGQGRIRCDSSLDVLLSADDVYETPKPPFVHVSQEESFNVGDSVSLEMPSIHSHVKASPLAQGVTLASVTGKRSPPPSPWQSVSEQQSAGDLASFAKKRSNATSTMPPVNDEEGYEAANELPGLSSEVKLEQKKRLYAYTLAIEGKCKQGSS